MKILIMVGIIAALGTGVMTLGNPKRVQPSDVFERGDARRLAEAACRGDITVVRELAERGIDVNAMGKEQVTALILAVHCENLDGVRALLEQGADPNQMAEGEVLPLAVAARRKDNGMIESLIDAGADVNGFQESEDTWPLNEASIRGIHEEDWSNYLLLLEKGADINLAYGHFFEGSRSGKIGNLLAGAGRFDKVLDLLRRGYIIDLESLLYVAQEREVSDDQEGYRLRVISFLEEKLKDS